MELLLLMVELYFSKFSKSPDLVVFKAIIADAYKKPFETIVYKINRSESVNSVLQC